MMDAPVPTIARLDVPHTMPTMARYFGYNPARNAVDSAVDEELYHLGPSHDLKGGGS